MKNKKNPQLIVAAAVAVAIHATAAHADLEVYVDGRIHSSGLGSIGPFQQIRDVEIGPLEAEAVAGAVLGYSAIGFPDGSLEATLTARANAVADYGINGVSIKSSLAAVTGTDRGQFLSGRMTGDLGVNGFGLPVEMNASSGWQDTFTIIGGTGLGTANINVTLDGSATSGYGENGTAFYNEITGTFEKFGRMGWGLLNYSLDVDYSEPIFDFGEDGPPGVIRYDDGWVAPLPSSVHEVGVVEDVLAGSFLFEYGSPFSLTSHLSVFGQHQIDIDYLHTAMLSLFDLPDGASLLSLSGHTYPTGAVTPPDPGPSTSVPEPATLGLFAIGGALLLVSRRRRLAARV